MTPTYRRGGAARRQPIKGPALIEEHASTTVLMPGDVCKVDAYGNLLITIAASA